MNYLARKIILVVVFFQAVCLCAQTKQPVFWLYCPVNFQVDKDTDRLADLLTRANKAGYSAAVVTDYKFGKLDERPDRYYQNMERIRALAESLKLELIPCIMPVGYSGSILQNNPDLAEGLSVRKLRMRIHNGLATPSDSTNLVPGGKFESAGRHAPSGWDWSDGMGHSTGLDKNIKHGGVSSVRLHQFRHGEQAQHGNCRLVKNLKLKPHHQYEIKLWVRTENLTSPHQFHVKVLAGNRNLQQANLGVKITQEWTQHRLSFNSLKHAGAKLYIGIWGGTEGSIWIDDVELRLVAGINLLRREGCSVLVQRVDDSKTLQEGKDFQAWVSPQTGRVPWPGEFRSWHEPPPLRIASGSTLKEGDEFFLSYYHAQTVYDGQVCCCLSHPELAAPLCRSNQGPDPGVPSKNLVYATR